MTLLAFGPQALLIGAFFVVTVLVSVTILANLAWRLCSNASIPANLPWAGVESTGGPLSRARASLRSISGMKALMDEGYYKVSGVAFASLDTGLCCPPFPANQNRVSVPLTS